MVETTVNDSSAHFVSAKNWKRRLLSSVCWYCHS